MLSTPENMIEKTFVEINIGNITTGTVLLNKVDIRTITMQNAMLPQNAKAKYLKNSATKPRSK